MENNQFNGTVIRKKKSNGMLIGVGAAIVVVIILIAAVAILLLNKDKDGAGNHDYIDIANQYVEQMDYSNAVKTYWAAIDAAPKRADYYVQLGELYEEMDKDEAACTVYQMGYERTQSQVLYLKWTTLRDQLGNKEQAINKGTGQGPGRQLLLNADLGDRFAFSPTVSIPLNTAPPRWIFRAADISPDITALTRTSFTIIRQETSTWSIPSTESRGTTSVRMRSCFITLPCC